MARLQRKGIAAPDEVRDVPLGRLELFQIGDASVGRTIFEPGWRWSGSMKPLAGTDFCEFHHMGYSVSGRFRVQSRDGAEIEIGPDQFYEIPPQHDAWVVGDEPWAAVDWGPAAAYGLAAGETTGRILATIMFTDIVGSTALARRLGDSRWRDLLATHNRIVRQHLDRFSGREVDTTGDGFLVLFHSAERAVRAGRAIAEAMLEVGVHIRAGIHTGEVELEGDRARGFSVHLASRVVALAAPDEVLVSWTTRDLLAGTSIQLDHRGIHDMKGLPEPRAVYAVVD